MQSKAAAPARVSVLKRITYLERRDDLDIGQFRAHWGSTHADIARDLPGVLRYRQNHVTSEIHPRSSEQPYRFDGIVELWFRGRDSVGAAFSSDLAERLAEDEKQFLAGLTGAPVASASPHPPWPLKVWLVGRWRNGPDLHRLRAGLQHLVADSGALGYDLNELEAGAPVLTRKTLRHEPELPQITVSVGYDSAPAASSAAHRLAARDDVLDLLSRPHIVVAEELTIL